MTRTHTKLATDADLRALLETAGLETQTIGAVLEIDALLQQWRRRARTRELGHRAVAALGLDIDLAQLDVLFAVAAPHHEFGDDLSRETMVSTVAERLGIDPSRASRVVAEMVNAGYARRVASQADARRTILELTDSGWTIVRAVQSFKWLLMGDYLASWSPDELETFVPLLSRFSEWSNAGNSEEKFETEIADLSRAVAAARTKTDETAS